MLSSRTLIAEYMGGTCIMSPRNCFSTALRTSCSWICSHGNSLQIYSIMIVIRNIIVGNESQRLQTLQQLSIILGESTLVFRQHWRAVRRIATNRCASIQGRGRLTSAHRPTVNLSHGLVAGPQHMWCGKSQLTIYQKNRFILLYLNYDRQSILRAMQIACLATWALGRLIGQDRLQYIHRQTSKQTNNLKK